MTPQEKAEDIVRKYSTYVVMWTGGVETERQNVKQCALITVQEIISEMSDYYDEYDCTKTLKKIEYWQEVKNELEKL
jgi:hypothetical protein